MDRSDKTPRLDDGMVPGFEFLATFVRITFNIF